MTRYFRLAALVLLVVVATAFVWRATPVSQAAPAATWTDVWSDQFNGAAGQRLDPANWTPQIGTSYPGGAPELGHR